MLRPTLALFDRLGAAKQRAIAGALRSRMLDVLVTDRTCALHALHDGLNGA